MLYDGRFLSWSDDHTLRLWSSEGNFLAALLGHTDRVIGVQVLENNRLLSWSEDSTIRLWSSEGEPLKVLEGHGSKVSGVHLLA
ncbi:WD40 repeat domain-containing protein, partial [Klebsiella pneumoniae]|uniref:WD40 repeat domain-containing protein n=1 Tax=Klebsiella pneumoniae TaxID=573 RepID=UPI0034DEA7A9